MADMGSFGGMDEENIEIKRLDAEVVSQHPFPIATSIPVSKR
jgi:hypothetical protein